MVVADGSQSLMQRRRVWIRKMQQVGAQACGLGATIVELISGLRFSHFDDATSAMYFIGSLKGDESDRRGIPGKWTRSLVTICQRCFSIDQVCAVSHDCSYPIEEVTNIFSIWWALFLQFHLLCPLTPPRFFTADPQFFSKQYITTGTQRQARCLLVACGKLSI